MFFHSAIDYKIIMYNKINKKIFDNRSQNVKNINLNGKFVPKKNLCLITPQIN